MVLGIDFGSSTTKIVLMDGKKIVEKKRIDHKASYEAVLQAMDLDQIEKIMVVGAGASFLNGDIMGIPTQHVEEFKAVGLGGHYLSGKDECLVVSLGTGTSFIYVNHERREHAGGTGMGGALLKTLAQLGLNMTDVDAFIKLAEAGDIRKADLLISDISKEDIGDLYAEVTAANMAKLTKESRPEDYAFGVCNLVFQNVGVMAALAARPFGTNQVVVMGSIGHSALALRCFSMVERLFGCEFIIPEEAVYGVAIGAMLYGSQN